MVAPCQMELIGLHDMIYGCEYLFIYSYTILATY